MSKLIPDVWSGQLLNQFHEASMFGNAIPRSDWVLLGWTNEQWVQAAYVMLQEDPPPVDLSGRGRIETMTDLQCWWQCKYPFEPCEGAGSMIEVPESSPVRAEVARIIRNIRIDERIPLTPVRWAGSDGQVTPIKMSPRMPEPDNHQLDAYRYLIGRGEFK